MESDILIDLKNIGVCYRTGRGLSFKHKEKHIWALKDVSFTLRKGDKLGVIGRNGCGKSTLMRVLAGIYSIDRGVAYFKPNLHVQLLSLGIGFEGNLSGRENAILNGMLIGKSRAHMLSRIERIKAFSELGDFFEMPVFTYSTGMHVRLGFSVALEANPDILLIDEIFGVGDASFLGKSIAALKETFTSDQTLVLISHDPQIIERYCTQAIWIDNGVSRTKNDAHAVGVAYANTFHPSPDL